MAEPNPRPDDGSGRPSRDQIREAPKVLLHDHLDGGLRPATVLELADQIGHDLPADDADALGRWFAESANSGSLERYLETFDHTVGGDADARPRSSRVARECVAGPGGRRGGLRRGPLRPGAARRPPVSASTRWSQPCGPASRPGWSTPTAGSSSDSCSPRCATRPARARSPSWRCSYRDAGVVGFDIAGAEAGFPPTRHLDAFEYLQRRERPLHDPRRRGVRAARRSGRRSSGAAPTGSATASGSSTTSPSTTTASAQLGRLAAYVRDKRIPLELRPPPTSRPGRPPRSPSIRSDCCTALRFRVTVNTDNRLMSADLDDLGDGRPRARRSATTSTTCAGSRSTR